MALRYAVLGLLSREVLSGYDLTQQFAAQIGHFWNAHHTQIYRELQKLETEGMVSHHVVEQQERPDKKMYALTEAGLEDLMKWLSEQPKPPKMKNESLLRVSLFHLIPPEQAITFLETSRQVHEHILSQMSQWREANGMGEGSRPAQGRIGEYLTVDYGMRFMKSWIEWCDFAIGVFREREEKSE